MLDNDITESFREVSAWLANRTAPAYSLRMIAIQKTFPRKACRAAAVNSKSGMKITPETTIPLWEGERIDDGMAVAGLLRLE